MAVFSINIDDSDVNRVTTAVCANYGYKPEIENPNFDPEQDQDPISNPLMIDNLETSSQFANRKTRDFLMEHTVAYEIKVQKEGISQPSPPSITDPN